MKSISTLPLAAALMGTVHNIANDGGHGKIGDSKTYSTDTGGSGGTIKSNTKGKLGDDTNAGMDSTIGDNLAKAGLDRVSSKDYVRVPGGGSA